MKNKMLLIVLCVCLALSLCACGGNEKTPEDTSKNEPDKITENSDKEEQKDDPEEGIVIKGNGSTLTDSYLVYEKDNLKVTLTDSSLGIEGDEYYSICTWQASFDIENNTDTTQTVKIAFPYDVEASEIYHFMGGASGKEVAPGTTLSFSDIATKVMVVDGRERVAKKYKDFERIPMILSINDDEEIEFTVMGLTIGGPYVDAVEVDYTGQFELKLAGEPHIRQTAKNPDYYTYAVDIIFTNKSDMTVSVGYSQMVAPGESVTVQSDIAEERNTPDVLNPHQTYTVSVYKESGAPLTKVTIGY